MKYDNNTSCSPFLLFSWFTTLNGFNPLLLLQSILRRYNSSNIQTNRRIILTHGSVKLCSDSTKILSADVFQVLLLYEALHLLIQNHKIRGYEWVNLAITWGHG